MIEVEKIASWVEEKPIVLVRLNEEMSKSIYNSRSMFEHLTVVKPHATFQDFKFPTLCLIELSEYDVTRCYLAVITRKTAVSSFDSRLTIKKLRPIKQQSLLLIKDSVGNSRMRHLLCDRIPPPEGISRLSSKLSSHVIRLLARDLENRSALNTAMSLLPRLRNRPDINWAQDDAIRFAMTAFGIRGKDIPEHVSLKRGSLSGLGLIGSYLYEDNVVHADASHLPGFDAIASDVTGHAVFQRRDEKLEIYTANKLPLERMFGVDLIYINQTRGNMVMIQYKMLESVREDDGRSDWQFRPNRQLYKEIDRMRLPEFEGLRSDYRLNRNPFFFKFVKRNVVDGPHQSFLVSLEHLNHMLLTPQNRGLRGGIIISYESLKGTYLRETEMIGLIRSGYIGSHDAETNALSVIISEASQGNRAVVLAWQKKIEELL